MIVDKEKGSGARPYAFLSIYIGYEVDGPGKLAYFLNGMLKHLFNS
jgi:hypothetical protein